MNQTTQLHLGVIPDGNRRWAKQRALQPWKGHEAAITAFRAIIDWAHADPRVAILTVWGLSTENWNRPARELTELMRIYEEFLRDEQTIFHEKKTRLLHSGRVDRIPASLAQLLNTITTETANYTDFTLNFALDHGGKDEIIRAAHKITDPKSLTEESFRQLLDHPELPDIDLVIRTSGEQRTSGFFIWQAAYAEWMFIDKYFPDLTPADLDTALSDFSTRQRRFGK